jgi:hypothetical protein
MLARPALPSTALQKQSDTCGCSWSLERGGMTRGMTRNRPVCALGNAEGGLCWQHDGSWQARRAAVGGLPCVCTHSSQAAVLVALNKILVSRSEPYDEVRRTARRGRPNPNRAQVVYISAFYFVSLCKGFINISKKSFFRRGKRQRNFSLFYFPSYAS